MGSARLPRAITIEDVAERAGVSAKTVSRVLNNEPNVRQNKREMVMQASRDLGYRPNPAARSLAGAKSFLIAHLYDNPAPEYIAAANDGIYAACRANGYFLLPEYVDPKANDRLDRLMNFLMTARADGVILTPPLCDDIEVLNILNQTDTPYASLSATHPSIGRPVINHDERAAARDLVLHLIGLGHREIAMITGPAGHNAARVRELGYIDALQQAGLSPRPDFSERGDYTMRSGIVFGQKLLCLPSRPTAIFAANDDMAVGVLTAAFSLGYQIPNDLSVVGYDDNRLASAVWPPLTTIRQPVAEMGRRAAERLMSPDPLQPDRETLDFKLIIRASTGPVPAYL
ncbi:MAG: LacI family transcriptional regulator [Hyphomonadaceae bacterium]|nr:LacI family transcriptional regulator [Hyphomonadaceae bacterium]CAI8401040.1 MAG: Catabolite control protein A [Hyphomonas sp. TMED17]